MAKSAKIAPKAKEGFRELPLQFRLTAILTFVGLLIASAPVYWGYSCRTSGQLCERSLVGPSQQAIDTNAESVVAEIRKSGDITNFGPFTLNRHDRWLRADRIDIGLRLRGKAELTIDSFIENISSSAAIYSSRSGRLAAVTSSKVDTIDRTHSQLISYIDVYALDGHLDHRKVRISCEFSVSAEHLITKNIVIEDLSREITIDVLTTCIYLKIDGRFSIRMLGNHEEVRSRPEIRGDRLTLKFDSNLRLTNVENQAAMDEKKNREKAEKDIAKEMDDCKEALGGKLPNTERVQIIVACETYVGKIGNTSWNKLYVHEQRDGKARQIGYFGCENSFDSQFVLAGDYQYVTANCINERKTDSKDNTAVAKGRQGHVYVITPMRSEPLIFGIGCDCTELFFRDVRFDQSSRTVNLEMVSDAVEITVQNRQVRIPPPTQNIAANQVTPSKLAVQFTEDGRFIEASVNKIISQIIEHKKQDNKGEKE
jgi:hypothetical protein